MQFNFAGVESLSTVDYPEHAAITIFFRGCGKRCKWCHNKEYLNGDTPVDIDVVLDLLDEASGFVSAVVLSGGEPLLQIEAVLEIAGYAQSIGLKVGIHTALPEELEKVKHKIDYAWVSDSNIHPKQPGSHRAIWYDHGGAKYERQY